jgi:hypothetical protein
MIATKKLKNEIEIERDQKLCNLKNERDQTNNYVNNWKIKPICWKTGMEKKNKYLKKIHREEIKTTMKADVCKQLVRPIGCTMILT